MRPHQLKMNISHKRINLLYIVGLGFSGSTLMSFILNSQPGIFSIGEMGPAPKIDTYGYRCSCGEEIICCPFFNKVKQRMLEQDQDFDLKAMDLHYIYSNKRYINILIMGWLKYWMIGLIGLVGMSLPLEGKFIVQKNLIVC